MSMVLIIKLIVRQVWNRASRSIVWWVSLTKAQSPPTPMTAIVTSHGCVSSRLTWRARRPRCHWVKLVREARERSSFWWMGRRADDRRPCISGQLPLACRREGSTMRLCSHKLSLQTKRCLRKRNNFFRWFQVVFRWVSGGIQVVLAKRNNLLGTSCTIAAVRFVRGAAHSVDAFLRCISPLRHKHRPPAFTSRGCSVKSQN